jgi:pimeloyl-ACP methyl ester carboxylesterase
MSKLPQYIQNWASELQANSHTSFQSIWLPTSFGKTHVWAAQSNDSHKPNLLFIPGWQACGLSWDLADQMQYYTPSHNVYLLDNIGQPGLSDPTPKWFRASQYSLWIKEVSDGLHLNHLSLIGESFGGFLTLNLALAAPHKIEKAILFAPAGFVQVIVGWKMIKHFAALRVRPTPRNAERFLKNIVYNAQHTHLQPQTKQRMADFMAMAFRHSSLIPPPPPYIFKDEQLKSIKVPIALIAGESDNLFNAPKTVARARQLLPQLKMTVLLPNADHSLVICPQAHQMARQFLGIV